MAASDNQLFEVPQVVVCAAALEEALQHARIIKPSTTIEPALTRNSFPEFLSQLHTIFSNEADADRDVDKSRQSTVVELVVRRRFDDLISTTSIDSPEFVEVWNILDITIILAEAGQCDSSVALNLVELLMDSQTLQGCQIFFDYLESRRERLIRDLSNMKGLIILRTCNDILRRLSRAEDISFSGRVFIFMFQSFPMGDKGTVNLRGSYHTENVTTREDIPPAEEQNSEKMDLDTKEDSHATKPSPTPGTKAVSFDAKDKSSSQKPLEPDALYPIFWSLQDYFCQPLKLFDAQNMSKFKAGLETTLVAFESVAQGHRNPQSSDDTKDVSKKRKRFELGSSDGGSFNPKYLTSRDLFELELSDLFFRRHILIQAVIILDFLRSLSATARARHANIRLPNKSVMYSDKAISEEDDKWAVSMKNRIQDYIYGGPDGAYVHRILVAVTQREKGWTRWKMETCPPMEKPAVTPSQFNDARESAKRLATSKRLRPHPMGSLNLDFLKAEDEESAMEKFKDLARWKLPDLATFKDKIAEDDLELDFAKSEKEKAQIVEAKASKTWRALRIASRSRMAALDKIDDWQDISAVFQEPKQADEKVEEEETGETGEKPKETQPIIISGPDAAGKSSLIASLQEHQPRVFQRVVRYTTRKPREGEVDGQDFHFIDSATFNRMSDNDQFVEMTNKDGYDLATSGKSVEAIKESGKVPLLEMDRASVQSVKDWGFSARTVFISVPSAGELETRLKSCGKHSADAISDIMKVAESELEQAKSDPSFYDITISNDARETAYKALENFIYGRAEGEINGTHNPSSTQDDDVAMGEGEPDGAVPSSVGETTETAPVEATTAEGHT